MKKNIVGLFVAALIVGMVGGAIGSYWMVNSMEVAVQTEITEINTIENSALIAAHQSVAPAVFSLVEYISAPGSNRNVSSLSFFESRDNLIEAGGGTGFIIDPSGIALTNKHVVANEGGTYVAIMDDGTELNVTIEAIDPGNDIAIVRLSALDDDSVAAEMEGNFPYVELGDSSELQVGQQVLTIGNALAEYENTTSAGIISATGRKVVAFDGFGETSTLYGLLQTDAAINPGNSGGPLINLEGEVVGINTAVDTEAQGIGFSIPINDVKPAIESWQKFGEIIRPMLGVRYIVLNRSWAQRLEISLDHGAFVTSSTQGQSAVIPGSPAAEVGLQKGDVVLEVDGEEINLDYTLQDAILRKQVGDEVELLVWRDGETFSVTVELTKLAQSE